MNPFSKKILMGFVAAFAVFAFYSPSIFAQAPGDGSFDPSAGSSTTSAPAEAAPESTARATSSPAQTETSGPALPAGSVPARPTATSTFATTSAPNPPTVTGQPAPMPISQPISAPASNKTTSTGSLSADQFTGGNEAGAGSGTIAFALSAVIIGLGGMVLILKSLMRGKANKNIQKNNQENQKEEKRCDDIKSLLEQKKKELEDMLRGWPEEKVKAMAKGVIMKELKKDEDVKKAIEEFEGAKKNYDDLKKAIELLERKYDLCMLKLPSAGRIRAAIFDLNGVFIQSPKLSERFFQEFHVPPEKFLPALDEVMEKVRMPGADDLYAYWKPYFDAWGVAIAREEFFNFWFGAEKEAAEMTELARELKKKGFKIFILSNNFRERTEYYDKTFPLLKEIPEKVYYSWQTGHVKTSEEAHQLILKENNLKPGECIFFDDSERNVETARKIGIKAFIFKDAAQVREFLG